MNTLPLSQMSDQALVQLYQSGDDRAFGVIAERYREQLRAVALYLLKHAHLVDDVLQETYIKAMTAITNGTYEDKGTLRAWLTTILHNKCMDHFRDPHVRRAAITLPTEYIRAEDVPSGNEWRPDYWLLKRERMQIFKETLPRLRTEQQAVLSLRVIEDLSFREIAERTGTKVNTCLGRMRYGTIALCSILGTPLPKDMRRRTA